MISNGSGKFLIKVMENYTRIRFLAYEIENVRDNSFIFTKLLKCVHFLTHFKIMKCVVIYLLHN